MNTLSGYYGGDSARSGSPDDSKDSWLQTTVEGEGTITFYWKVYSELECDYLQFIVDDEVEYDISGDVGWEQKQFNVSGSGTHTLKWRYIKDSEGEDGDDRGSVDYVQWSGSSPPDPTEWDSITYTYDPAGRRIKKNVVGSYIVKYVYDGGHVIAEYDDSALLRKYIYGARVDEPVCMIDVADNNKAYYYHFDGLGSVVALSDSTGEVVEQYVYDVFGQPALQGSPSTVGNKQVFSYTNTSADRRAVPYTMPEDGNIQSICIYHDGGTGNLILAVYDDSSGKPNTRLGVTQSTPINASEGWQTVELTSPVDVQEGQTIWLAWVFENNPGIRYTTGSPGRAASGVGWSGGMPESFGSSTTDSYIYSIYATYTTEQEEAPELIGNPYMFTGRRFDIETGLYYYRARYYNPHIGRFMQTDPVGYGAGMNWYLYCRNNPVGWVDSTGCEPKLATNLFGQKKNYPGYLNDVWTRAAGHPVPRNLYYPYYTQGHVYSCAPVSVLNWWLTYDQPLPEEQSSDTDAENYITNRMGPNQDWNEMGVTTLTKARSIIDPTKTKTTVHNTASKKTLSIDVIVANVGTQKKAIMTGYDADARDNFRSWHCIMIVPTPKDYFEAHSLDLEKKIAVIDPMHVSLKTFTVDEFKTWWAEREKFGIWHQLIIGNDKVPGQ